MNLISSIMEERTGSNSTLYNLLSTCVTFARAPPLYEFDFPGRERYPIWRLKICTNVITIAKIVLETEYSKYKKWGAGM